MTIVALNYTGMQLDRAGAARNAPGWSEQQLQRKEARIVPLWRYQHLVSHPDTQATPKLVTLSLAEARAAQPNLGDLVFLGLCEQEQPFFAADFSSLSESDAGSVKPDCELYDLRRIGPLMDQGEASMMAYSRAMLYWHRHHRFCGRCGSHTESRRGGHMRQCMNDKCGKEIYPRTDPAIITLVENRPAPGEQPKCLLGHSKRLPQGVYSTLAGFVEPGESLEETVVREVEEESGVVVDQVKYMASQPWPFPGSIMVAYRATAKTTAITIDEEELDDVRWFSLEEVRQFGEWEDETAEFRLPRPDSIARFLVNSWLQDHAGK
ncbi:NAD(+) diphosphatase [Spongorhabdus nitratireducens]